MKKFLKIALLAMAAVMLLSVCVGAANVTLYADGSNATRTEDFNSQIAALPGDAPAGATVEWSSNHESIATVVNGVVTAVAPGNATITAIYGTTVLGRFEVEVINRTLDSITVKTYPTKMTYVSGDMFDPTGMVITAHYNNGDNDDVTSGYTCTANPSPLRVGSVVTVSYGGRDCQITPTVTEIYPTGIAFAEGVKSSYKVGEYANEIEIVVTYSDNSKTTITSGFDQTPASSTKLTKSHDGTKLTVSYGGYQIEKTLSVTEQVVEKTFKVDTAPTKTEYRVGEKLNPAGMKLRLYENGAATNTVYTVTNVTMNAFAEKDVGNTSVDITVTLDGKSYTVTVTGLTIKAASTALDIKSITSVTLDKDKYPVGYEFSLDDIAKIYVKNKNGVSVNIKGSELDNYSNDFDLQVLDEDGDEKRASRAALIEEDDVIQNSSGKSIVNMILYIDSKYCEFTVSVGDSGVAFYYDGDLIKRYDDLEDALDATIEQDKDVSTRDFDLDDVSDKEYILIKLGEDYEISTRYEFDPECNVVIDLNGHDLTFYTDTVAISRVNDDYTVTIRNSSKTAAKFIYDDKTNGEITLAQNETLVFEYDEDLPGFYTLTIKADTNGSILVKGNTKAVTSLEVAHGSDITFTVTPAQGYQIDAVKYDGKTLTTTNQTIPYTVSKDGVATVTLKGIAKSAALEATFKKVTEEKTEEKKEETAKKWNNPFSDITERSQYYSAVEFVCSNELFNGVSATKFAPENTMTRAMFVTVLGRLAAKTQNIDFTQYTASSFTDVSASNPQNGYAAPYIEWASRVGIVEGYGDGTFGPNNNITHQQMYLMMQRYASFIEHKYTDASQTTLTASDASKVADWALNGVKYAQSAKIMVSTSKVDPAGNALRWELATVLMLFCQNVLNGSIK